MDSKLNSLIKLFENNTASRLCNKAPCATIECKACPFTSEEALGETIALLKTYQVLED